MAWTMLTSIKGPPGTQGPTGEQGQQGIPGPAGEDGAGVAIAGSVPTYADLPTLTADDVGDGYLVEADGLLYVWDGSAYMSGVAFRGPAGPEGPQGATGATGAQGVQGDPGAIGPTGPAGSDGSDGQRGSLWYAAAGSPEQNASVVTGAMSGDLYLDTTDGTVWRL